jgi:histidinol-phosphate aminotransferase
MEIRTNKRNLDKQKAAGGPRPVHGSITPAELRALGLRPDDVLDFSASISPIGPPEGVWEAMRGVDLATYPDPECLDLREAISGQLSAPGSDIPISRIQAGNGSTEIFHLIARAYLTGQGPKPTKAVLMTPTYGEYAGACRLAGAEITTLEADRSHGFRWDLEAAGGHIEAERPNVVILCNPNNPTGVYVRRPEVEALADAAERAGSLFVIDEAYLSFVRDPWDSLSLLERANVVLVRSMTKDYALTGLRLGYALAGEAVVATLRSFQPDWSVNALAQQAGVAALADSEYLPRARQAVFQAKEFLTRRLGSLGLQVIPSEANFLLVDVGDAAAWRSQLLNKGFVVRDCASFGLPEYIRIGIRLLPDCQRLVEAMEQLVGLPGLAHCKVPET